MASKGQASKGQASKGRSTRQPAQRAGKIRKPKDKATAPQITQQEIAAVARQLAEAFEQKPLTANYVLEVLEHCASQQQNEQIKQALMGVRLSIRNGSTLSGALTRYPDIFDMRFVHAVQ